MKSLSNLLHRTPWWALILGGFGVIIALGVLVTPFHLIEYRREGSTPEERRAIKREVDLTFAEGGMDLLHSALAAMHGSTKDPARRDELGRALQELDRVREELRERGAEALEARREAVDTARDAVREATQAIEEARGNAAEALKDAGIENPRVLEALDESLRAARQAEEEAKKALESDRHVPRKIVIDMGVGEKGPTVDINVGKAKPGEKSGVKVETPEAVKDFAKGFADGWRDGGRIAVPKAPPAPSTPLPPPAAALPGPVAGISLPPALPLPPELRAQIREHVGDDIKKLGIGAALVLLFVPVFIVTVISKFFIDRSRAAQRMADLKRKEAEYHLMSRQVTEAKLQALQAQVEPHFLYNTLANVQALTEVDPARANTMVGHLIQYLRSALPKMRESISTVGQEIELVRAYLSILQMRMGKRLAFDIAVPESLLATPFPPLMLPSLVENAIKHGLEPQREGGSVHISAQVLEGRLRLTVADTGRGFGETIGAGVGLANIRERLAALYGDEAKLTLEANAPHGVIATIEAPIDGAKAPATDAGPGAPAVPAPPKSAAGKVFSAMGTVERMWRKSLSFAFIALVIVAAVVSGLAIAGVVTGILPVHIGSETVTGAGGALLGTAGIVIGFAVVVLALALVVALLYGLGFMFAGLAIFIPLVILVSMAPVLAPFVLVGLVVWWFVRRSKKAKEAAAAAAQPAKVEPTMGVSPPSPPADPPKDDRPVA
jgi:Zn-dependent protease with chaperone function